MFTVLHLVLKALLKQRKLLVFQQTKTSTLFLKLTNILKIKKLHLQKQKQTGMLNLMHGQKKILNSRSFGMLTIQTRQQMNLLKMLNTK